MKRDGMARGLVVTGALSAVVIVGAGFALLQVETHAAKPVPPLRTDSEIADSRTEIIDIAKKTPAPTVENRYFVLKPGYELVLEGGDEKVVITVLDETMQIAGTTTQIVEEREEKDGEIAEVSRSYYAIPEKTGDVLYFGEDVQIIKNGKVVARSGSWRAGEKDAKAGMMMPGAPLRGLKYSQENSPGQAMDSVEIVGTNETIKTPAGTFTECVKTEETSALRPEEKGSKTYAPGIGLVQDGDRLLTRHGFVKR